MRKTTLKTMLFAGCVLLAGSAASRAGDGGARLKLMPGDRISVKIFDDEQMSGSYAIDSSGTITLPAVGEIKVSGMTLESCQSSIKEALSRGYLVNPIVSVRVDKYRPLYIYGQIKAPGAYPFRIGMTARSAIAIAGGTPVLASAALGAGDVILQSERLSSLSAKRVELIVRLAALQAMSQGRSEVSAASLPADVQMGRGFMELLDSQNKMAAAELAAFNAEVGMIERQKPQNELERQSLDGQLATQTNMVDLLQKNVTELQGLRTKGLLKTGSMFEQYRQLNLEESAKATLKTQIARNEIERSAIDLKIIEKQNDFKQRLLQRTAEAKRDLADVTIQISSLQKARQRSQRSGELINSADGPSFVIYRDVDGKQTSIEATSGTSLEPGDVLEVRELEPGNGAESGPNNEDLRSHSQRPSIDRIDYRRLPKAAPARQPAATARKTTHPPTTRLVEASHYFVRRDRANLRRDDDDDDETPSLRHVAWVKLQR